MGLVCGVDGGVAVASWILVSACRLQFALTATWHKNKAIKLHVGGEAQVSPT